MPFTPFHNYFDYHSFQEFSSLTLLISCNIVLVDPCISCAHQHEQLACLHAIQDQTGQGLPQGHCSSQPHV